MPGRGNPRVRVDARVLEDYRRLASRLGVSTGELVSMVLQAALESPAVLWEAAYRLAEKRRRTADYEFYTLWRWVWRHARQRRSGEENGVIVLGDPNSFRPALTPSQP